jgi:hypothetical protein
MEMPVTIVGSQTRFFFNLVNFAPLASAAHLVSYTPLLPFLSLPLPLPNLAGRRCCITPPPPPSYHTLIPQP